MVKEQAGAQHRQPRGLWLENQAEGPTCYRAGLDRETQREFGCLVSLFSAAATHCHHFSVFNKHKCIIIFQCGKSYVTETWTFLWGHMLPTRFVSRLVVGQLLVV